MPDSDYAQNMTEIIDELRLRLDVLCPLVNELETRIQELEAQHDYEDSIRMERNERCE